jgi:predicted glycosyltransferase
VTRVLFWVQHLLGSGHVERLRWVAEALAERGAAVTFVTGGMPLPARMPRGAAIVQLPPVRAADATFAALVDAGGSPVDDVLRARRARELLAAYESARPDVVVLETYPFGRRALRFELESLLARIASARARPRVVVSVRDLLQRRDDSARDAAAWSQARQSVDAIIVHGEAAFARLEETFPPAADGAIPVFYTGYVRAPLPASPPRERGEVVVSASGGDVGEALLHAAIAARPVSALRDLRWRVLVGPGVSAARFDEMRAAGAAAGTIVERHRDDFFELLAGARVAVTQAGYNTVLDVLAARAPSVLVPFEGHGETEQRMRAMRLASLGRAEVLRERDLTAATLADAINRAAAHVEMPPCPFALDGARRAATRILELAGAKEQR